MNKKDIQKIKQDSMSPVVMKKIVDAILDPKNPDSESVKKNVIKAIADAVKKDNAFMTTIKGICIEKGEEVTTHVVHQSINDSRDQLTNALVTTINMQCQDYFEEQKGIIHKVVKQTLDKCVQEIIKDTKALIDTNSKKLEESAKKTESLVSVPVEYKEDVKRYVEFLRSKTT